MIDKGRDHQKNLKLRSCHAVFRILIRETAFSIFVKPTNATASNINIFSIYPIKPHSEILSASIILFGGFSVMSNNLHSISL